MFILPRVQQNHFFFPEEFLYFRRLAGPLQTICSVRESASEIHIFTRSLAHTAACPCCDQISASLHATYHRRIQTLPLRRKYTCLRMTAYKFDCVNPRCPRVLAGRIANFLEKLDVAEGFRDSTFYTLVQKNCISTIADLFTLHQKVSEVTNALGSRLEAEKLFKGLYQLKTRTFEVSQVIGSMGIDGISIKTCQNIFSDVSLDYLLEMKKNRIYLELMNVEGVGPTVAAVLSDWLNENRDLIDFLMENMHIVPDRISYGTVVFTGFRNKEYAERFKAIGFPVTENVTRDTVACVYSGDITSGNARKALNKDVPLVHVGQLDELLKELTARDEELRNKDIQYGHYQLIRDIQSHVPCYRS